MRRLSKGTKRPFAGSGDMCSGYNVSIEQDSEGYLIASIPELPGCHTQAKTLDKLRERIKEAIELCLNPE